jgi:hypothetical protein
VATLKYLALSADIAVTLPLGSILHLVLVGDTAYWVIGASLTVISCLSSLTVNASEPPADNKNRQNGRAARVFHNVFICSPP